MNNYRIIMMVYFYKYVYNKDNFFVDKNKHY